MKVLHALFIFAGVTLLSQQLYAAAGWIPAASIDDSCHATCGRAGLETVASNSAEQQSVSIGVLVNGKNSKVVNGNGKILGKIKGQRAYCLCAEDGKDKGGDFAWASHTYPAKCDQTCGKMAPHYGYAVYTNHNKKTWNQVCANKNGELGNSRRRIGDCTINNKPHKSFGCLCTRSFVPDLEPGVDP